MRLRTHMWLQARDGRYFRNCPLVSEEQHRLPIWRWRLRRELELEWRRLFRNGPTYKDILEPGDVVVDGMPMREAYPGHPGLWSIDEEGRR